jgi:RHS repeat-associated protein
MTKFTLRQAQGIAFTGQYSYMDDITTQNVTEGFGLMDYNARMYDPALGRFTQADTIIPSTQGVQAWDRFAYTNNNPVRYSDPTGHEAIPWNTFFISFTPINISTFIGGTAGFGVAVDLRPINTFIENTITDGNLDTSKLPEELNIMINDISAGIYTSYGVSAGFEGGAQFNATFGVSTKTMDEWAGTTTIAEELSVHGEYCAAVCVGAVVADNYATENSIDTFGISIGGGAEYGLGIGLTTTNNWVAVK